MKVGPSRHLPPPASRLSDIADILVVTLLMGCAFVIALLTALPIVLGRTQDIDLSVALTAAAGFMILLGLCFVFMRIGGPFFLLTPRASDLDTRLKQLTEALARSGATIAAIEQEIAARKELVSQLQVQKAIAEQAITLSQEQVDAVSAILERPVARFARRDLWIQIAIAAFFFVLGVVATLLIG